MRPELNFSPQPFRRNHPFQIAISLVNIALAVFLVYSGFYGWHIIQEDLDKSGAFSELETRQRMLDKQFSDIQTQLQALDLRSHDSEIRFYAAIENEMQVPWIDIMDTLGGLIPEGVRIVEVTSERNNRDAVAGTQTLHFVAVSRTKKEEIAFLKKLQNQKGFSRVLLKSETYEHSEIGFEGSFSYVGEDEHEDL